MKAVITVLSLVLALPTVAAELLVLNKNEASLSFIDPASGTTHKTIATGDGPHEIELSGDGSWAFVSNYGANTPGNTLSIVDVKARTETRRFELGELSRPHGLSFAAERLYLTSETSKRIASFDPTALRIDWQFDTTQEGTHMVLAARDGKTLFATNMGSGSVSIIERKDEGVWRQTLVAVGAGPEGLDVSPDGRELWVAHSRDGGISIIDVATQKVKHTFDARTRRSNRLKFSRDGKRVLVSDLSGGELVVIDADTHKELARVPVGPFVTGILVPPQGDEVFVAVSGADRIAVFDVKALKVVRTIATGKSPDGMAWVP